MRVIVFLCVVVQIFCKDYQVSVTRVSQKTMPLGNAFDEEVSTFAYNYNPGYIPIYKDKQIEQEGLVIRLQEMTLDPYPFEVNPSKIAITLAKNNTFKDINNIQLQSINNTQVILESEGRLENFGVEDPRLSFRESNGQYNMWYSGVQSWGNNNIQAMLLMAQSDDPLNKTSWKRLQTCLVGQYLYLGDDQNHEKYEKMQIKSHKEMLLQMADENWVYTECQKIVSYPLASIYWSKSGAVIWRDELNQLPLLFWGEGIISLAMGVDKTGTCYQTIMNPFISPRLGFFDSHLVEPGPPPLRLSDGNYFMIYNSARFGYVSLKPDWNVQYNVGYLILDYNDPTKILKRSDQPILSPETAWEIADDSRYPGLTPNVVFVEAMKQIGPDEFLIFYGAADSTIGSATVKIDITN